MVEVAKKQNWGKYSTWNRGVFWVLDALGVYPLCNWGRRNKKGVTVVRNVRYGEWPRNEGDIFYLSEIASEKKPVFLQIHGGGFVGSNREAREALCLWYARQGFFVYNINYTLAPEGRFPQGVIDCINAFNWIYDNAERYNLDTSKIVVGGDSAGGYYTSSVGVITTNPSLQARFKVTPLGKPLACVLNCGLYDIQKVIKSKVIFNMGKTICLDITGVGIDELDKFEYYPEISSIDFLNKDFPSSFIAWAKRDMFCLGQGQRFVQKLRDLGVFCVDYGGERKIDNHVFPLFWFIKSAKESNAKLKDFLRNVLEDPIANSSAEVNA